MTTNERILQYVWKYKLYREAEWLTADGERLQVIAPGLQNTDAGPDFFNAKVRIGETVWAGDVEIHVRASDWKRHGHDRDPAYDSVILHVVEVDDEPVRRTNGSLIPQIVLRVPERVLRSIDWLLARERPVPCLARIGDIDAFRLSSWITTLLTERLERKTNDIFRRLERTRDDWNEAFYITLSRNFGFGTNGDAFEWLAFGLPFKYLRKQRHSPMQIEALLFGRAGMLADEHDDDYYRTLQREYAFLSKKYDLPTPIDGFLFKQFRTRPVNFPHLRMAQLASVWAHHDTLFSEILEPDITAERLMACFAVTPSDYWARHYHFGAPSPVHKTSIGLSAIRVLLINTVVPMLFAYGKRHKRPEYGERALRLLESLPPEGNAVIRTFTDAGLAVRNAADSQALLQLRREYCDRGRCLSCRIGFCLIKRAMPVQRVVGSASALSAFV